MRAVAHGGENVEQQLSFRTTDKRQIVLELLPVFEFQEKFCCAALFFFCFEAQVPTAASYSSDGRISPLYSALPWSWSQPRLLISLRRGEGEVMYDGGYHPPPPQMRQPNGQPGFFTHHLSYCKLPHPNTTILPLYA